MVAICLIRYFCALHSLGYIMIQSDPAISFDNTENAFAYKTDKQLKKANFLFSSMSRTWLVKLGTKVTPWIIRSGLPVKGLIRNTIFEADTMKRGGDRLLFIFARL